ncbi:uncharacterized protein RHO25_003095 [Cercospora beticola]|uniref:Dolichol-phosphate mannose synthase subunit 3 n=1 Tax=Cercospora beticola TaxID=122368 RepID=A0ABZ0NG27_CERBT|nr:hypothetical protein RHO25_003095 [Cercospora beticola]
MEPYMTSAGAWATDAPDSVNPAELSAIDIWDLSIFNDPFELPVEPTAPLPITAMPIERLRSLPKHSRVSLLSTSPPDLGWQWNPLSATSSTRRTSHGQLALSRENSSSSIRQSSAGSQLSPKATKPSRGRLLADTSAQGPETVFEDSDSHHSWTASDNFETWCNSLREQLADFRRCKERTVIITSLLQTRQRRKVHSMANLLGLSHMSLGHGRSKQILISKCELANTNNATSTFREKRWNPTRNNWSRGLVDPRVVLIEGLSGTAVRLQQHLYNAGLPQASHMTIDNGQPRGQEQASSWNTIYACFETADDAATVVLSLDHSKPNWNAYDGFIECDYVRFSPGTDLDAGLLSNFDVLPQLLRESTLYRQDSRNTSFVGQGTDCALYSDSDEGDEWQSPGLTMPVQRFVSRLASNESSRSRDAGYASGGSALSLMLSDHSEGSATKKRKRMPKIPGGFPCQMTGCDKVFNRDGDRRKHEKNHLYTILFAGLLPLPAAIQTEIIPYLPFWALISFGAYLLGKLGYGVLTFNDVPEAHEELMQQIQEARKDLKTKGVDVD